MLEIAASLEVASKSSVLEVGAFEVGSFELALLEVASMAVGSLASFVSLHIGLLEAASEVASLYVGWLEVG